MELGTPTHVTSKGLNEWVGDDFHASDKTMTYAFYALNQGFLSLRSGRVTRDSDQPNYTYTFNRIVLAILFSIGLFLILGVYQTGNLRVVDRISSLQQEERVRWAVDLFEARESQGGNIGGLLFARPGPLPPEFCENLAHANLPDLWRPDRCFSRVLHGNIPRLVVDFGLVPTLLFCSTFFYFLAIHLGWRGSFLITSIIFLNGLSVSGFGNELIMSAVAVAIVSANVSRHGQRVI